MMFLRNLRSGVGGPSPENVWRRILTDHPQLLDLLKPGNEERLQQARQRFPKLESAINNFGYPSAALLQEIADGGERGTSNSRGAVSNASTLPFLEEHKLSDDQLKAFFADGYILCKNAVPHELITLAKRHINACLGARKGEIKHNMMVLPHDLSSHQHIMNLFSGVGSKLPTIAQSLLGQGNCKPPFGAQVALRFPSSFVNVEDDSRRYNMNSSCVLFASVYYKFSPFIP